MTTPNAIGADVPAYLLTDRAIQWEWRRAFDARDHARQAEMSKESHLRARESEQRMARRAERFACIGNGLFVRSRSRSS